MTNEFEHRGLEFLLAHLSVSHQDAGLRADSLEHRRYRVDRFYAIVNEVYLAFPSQLLLQCTLNYRFAETYYNCLYSQSITWRSFNNRHVPNSNQRHM